MLQNHPSISGMYASPSENQGGLPALSADLPNSDAPEAVSTPSTFENAPEADFSLAQNRQKMHDALDKIHASVPLIVRPVSGGHARAPEMPIGRQNPSQNSEIVAQTYYATPADVDDALESAEKSFAMWRDTPVKDRAWALEKVAEYFELHKWEICATMILEVGKPWRDADADVAEAIDFCRFYAREMLRLDAPRTRNVPGEWNNTTYEGRGVTVVIAPWNFPLAILTGMAVAALVAGNPVILKPAEQSCATAKWLYDALIAVGVPPSVVHFLPGDGETVGAALVRDRRVACIAFTGSRAVGLQILKEAAVVQPGQRELKRVVCEMGGKNAIIVDDDADLDEAVAGVVASFAGFAGQKCSACSRVIVVGKSYATFCERLRNAVATLRIGRADDPATTLPPVVDTDSVARVARYREIGLREGTLLAECPVPEDLAGTGNFVPALVFRDVDVTGKLWTDEIFAPVLAVANVPTLEDALRLALQSEYALTGGFYSRSPANIARVRKEFRVGNLYINRKITGAMVDRQPFGGHGMSGGGTKAGGSDYLSNFLTSRVVTESVMRRGFAPTGGE